MENSKTHLPVIRTVKGLVDGKPYRDPAWLHQVSDAHWLQLPPCYRAFPTSPRLHALTIMQSEC